MAETLKRTVVLNPQRMGLIEQLRQDWVVNAEEGTTIQDVLNPAYWSHMSAQMQIYDHVEVRLETGEWILDLIVLGVGRNWATVHLAHKHDLQPVEDSMPSMQSLSVAWKGPQLKWVVIRLSDSEILQKNFESKGDAQVWATNHEAVVLKT